jgi:nicotinamidase/pyrazinamidase
VADGHSIAAELNRQATFSQFRLGSKDAHPANAVWVASDASQVLTPIEGDNVDVRWPIHAVPGTVGFELLFGLPHPKDYDYFVWKGIEPDMHPYGACYHDHAEKLGTGVIEFLKLNAVDTVLVGGLALDYCVKKTALQLVQAGFKVIINLAATRAIAANTAQIASDELLLNGAQFIQSTDELTLL